MGQYSQPSHIEDTSYVEVKNLLRGPVRCWFKRSTPCCAGVGDQYMELGCVFFDFIKQSLCVFEICDICRQANGFAFDPLEFVELFNSLVDALRTFCFTSSDYDQFNACLEEGCCCVES